MFSWLFPHYCVICKQRSDLDLSICANCFSKLERVPHPICLYCGYPTYGRNQHAESCVDCNGKTKPFLFARSALLRDEQTLSLIHRLKYCGDVFLARVGGLVLSELWEKYNELSSIKDWCLVPVPISDKRMTTRHYNQAEELARYLAQERGGGMSIVQPLRRIASQTRSQASLSANQRRLHAMSVFRLKDAYAKGKKKLPANILLVDDVYTTGATARACARLLKKVNGVKRIGVITLLRVPKHHH